MKIRSKILVNFSITVLAITALSLCLIYFLYAANREEEFQQRQKEKIEITISLLRQYKDMSESLTGIMDQLTINDFYDEKMLVFDQNKTLIYASVDDLPINNYTQLLSKLSPANHWVETREGKYDVVAIYIQSGSRSFYAISKAYDAYGFAKLNFLRNTMLIIFVVTVLVVLAVSFLLARKISQPLADLTKRLSDFKPGEEQVEMGTQTNTYEIHYLNQKFNELMLRTNEAFLFQKHSIHHISHELKTPLAVLVSELEKLKNVTDIELVRQQLENQVAKAKSLGSMINVLLEIAKMESGQTIPSQSIRVDELIFDVIDELVSVYPHFNFDVQYQPEEFDFERLTITGNEMLIRQVFLNLLTNSINYSDNNNAQLVINCSSSSTVTISIMNTGQPVSKDEEPFLFGRFFRGKNSKGKMGFGLGLILSKKIVDHYAGKIEYHNPAANENIFRVQLPLS
ncbi:sensor histidine kinase [Aridibaculum aurantiacum]|uniref:sensor histidine kinase n=1 Tax=Aridibaculum aurantiacum TaxID=2810307 RepID=UPI001A978D3C|nr:HAMP domain-containing sensor histidine kinase [Aridibaculum aurantiacum]